MKYRYVEHSSSLVAYILWFLTTKLISYIPGFLSSGKTLQLSWGHDRGKGGVLQHRLFMVNSGIILSFSKV